MTILRGRGNQEDINDSETEDVREWPCSSCSRMGWTTFGASTVIRDYVVWSPENLEEVRL